MTVNTGDSDEFAEFFAPLAVEVPLAILKGDNKIAIEAQDGTTITSVQLATLSRE